MAVNNLFRFAGIVFRGAQFGGVITLGGVTTSAVNMNPQVVQDYSDGNIHPTLTTLQAFAEDLQFTTNNVDKALALIGSVGECIDDGSAIEVYYSRLSACAKGPAPGAVHRRIVITQSGATAGLVYPNSFSCDHRGNASFSFSVMPETDGANSPIVIQSDIALPAELQVLIDNQNRYTIGPVNLAGDVYEGVKQVSIEFGISLIRESADSVPFDEFIAIEKTANKISLTGIDPTWASSNVAGGAAGTIEGVQLQHADTSIVFRRRVNGTARFEPAGDPVHVVLSTNGLAVVTNVASTNEQQPAESGVDIYSDFDGANVPITVQTDSAY